MVGVDPTPECLETGVTPANAMTAPFLDTCHNWLLTALNVPLVQEACRLGPELQPEPLAGSAPGEGSTPVSLFPGRDRQERNVGWADSRAREVSSEETELGLNPEDERVSRQPEVMQEEGDSGLEADQQDLRLLEQFGLAAVRGLKETDDQSGQ
ncbi:hypothetical protein Cadr_000026026 [Camelus dromedarius]|uniref:Uncharacterized protein n=1 Tax=Camelus dromedarius TaxID=9838 RepID=A0A5N4CEF8_CAMDR|nr:hypothetical protein Cadr_000026026 [Camelus dromedarius]